MRIHSQKIQSKTLTGTLKLLTYSGKKFFGLTSLGGILFYENFSVLSFEAEILLVAIQC